MPSEVSGSGDHGGDTCADAYMRTTGLMPIDPPPFDIKRVYFIYGTKPGVVRGKHSHKTCRQLAICVKGSCVIDMDDGLAKWSVNLDDPTKGLYLRSEWHEMRDFSEDCVVVVLADQPYDEADYIRKYEEFKARHDSFR